MLNYIVICRSKGQKAFAITLLSTITDALKPINDFKVGINPDIKLEGVGVAILEADKRSKTLLGSMTKQLETVNNNIGEIVAHS